MEEGGATVFLNQGIITYPSKGSILFWYNMKPSGKVATEALHAGCPTIYGTKWSKFFKHKQKRYLCFW